MQNSLSTVPSLSSNHGIPLFFAFIAAGQAGNYFKHPIYQHIDFLFGSFFALLGIAIRR
jgi:hypothetical protein